MMKVNLLNGHLHRGSDSAAGYDLFATADCYIPPQTRVAIPTGVRTQMESGVVGLIRDRSGLALNKGLTVLAGVIDGDYQKEWAVLLYNTSTESVLLTEGDRIAQVLFVETVHSVQEASPKAEVSCGEKRTGGFGSTGK